MSVVEPKSSNQISVITPVRILWKSTLIYINCLGNLIAKWTRYCSILRSWYILEIYCEYCMLSFWIHAYTTTKGVRTLPQVDKSSIQEHLNHWNERSQHFLCTDAEENSCDWTSPVLMPTAQCSSSPKRKNEKRKIMWFIWSTISMLHYIISEKNQSQSIHILSTSQLA